MPDTTPNLGLELLPTGGSASAELIHNEALGMIDGLIPHRVLDRTNSPPGSPSNGDVYIVTATATGAWTGKEDDIAIYYEGWRFVTPANGWMFFVDDEDEWVHFVTGTGWVAGIVVPTFNNGNRPAAGVQGRIIYNTTDNGLNVDDGTNWREPSGGWVTT